MVSTKFRDYNVNSNDAISIIFVHNLSSIENHMLKFKPAMTHQIFDEENVYGYHNLKINIYYAAHSAIVYVSITYDESAQDSGKFGLEPDNILAMLKPWFPNNMLTNLEEFKDCVRKCEPDYIYGECVDCFTSKNEQGVITGFRVIDCDLQVVGFKKFHKRFQSLIIMFIDAANFIDLDDPSWRILYLYEECRVNGKKRYCPVGFCSMYLFKSTTTIARISQFFIVPFLQRLGLGYKLLAATYDYLKANNSALEEITVESPNRVFTRMRDNLDVSYLIKDSAFRKGHLFNGFSDKMLIRARLRYKLTNEQARKIYEILRCFYAQEDEGEYEAFMFDVKKNRKSQILIKKAQMKFCNKLRFGEADIELPIMHSITLQEEFDKFVGSIQMTLKYIQKQYGNPSRTN